MRQRFATNIGDLTTLMRLSMVALLLGGALALAGPRPAQAEEAPLLRYQVDLVSNYVARGEDQFVSTFDKEGKPHGAFNAAPALQPSLTLHGPAGFSLGLWSSWALTDRAPEPAKGFAGLETLDEIDYTLSWSWDNRLGAFTAGWALYTLVPEREASNELFFSIAPKALEAVGGVFTHWVVPDAGAPSAATYSHLALGGGEALTWSLHFGMSHALQEVTAGLGMPLGPLSVSVYAAYRPNPELVGTDSLGQPLYSPEGRYTAATGKVEDYPPAVVWLTLSYGGTIAP